MAVDFLRERVRMVAAQVAARGVRDRAVLEAMRRVPRHAFVAPELWERAYEDTPLPIGEQQTISQPYMVAVMSEALAARAGERILEVGTGSGYGSAVAREIVGAGGLVVSVEIDPLTFAFAKANLEAAAYRDIVLVHGDGGLGYPELSPYDRIAVTAACSPIPPPLIEQLAIGGRLVAPVIEEGAQNLRLLEKTAEGIRTRVIGEVLYVSLRGAYAA